LTTGTSTSSVGTGVPAGGTVTVDHDGDTDTDVHWNEMSALNNWRVEVVAYDTPGLTLVPGDHNGGGNDNYYGYAVDADTKTMYIAYHAEPIPTFPWANDNLAYNALGGAAAEILGKTYDLTNTNIINNINASDFSGIDGTLLYAGDTFILNHGGAAGELELVYETGTTVAAMVNEINNTYYDNFDSDLINIQAQVDVNGDGSKKLSDFDSLDGSGTKYDPWVRFNGGLSEVDDYAANIRAKELQELLQGDSRINENFDVQLLLNAASNRKFAFSDSVAYTGTASQFNALQWTGLGDTKVKLTLGSAGDPLSFELSGGVLEIKLEVGADGKSKTSANDIVAFLNDKRIWAESVGGIGVSIVTPVGVDINGRVWDIDRIDNKGDYNNDGVYEENDVFKESTVKYGVGIVEATDDAFELNGKTQSIDNFIGRDPATFASDVSMGGVQTEEAPVGSKAPKGIVMLGAEDSEIDFGNINNEVGQINVVAVEGKFEVVEGGDLTAELIGQIDYYTTYQDVTITTGGALVQMGKDVVSSQQTHIGIAAMLLTTIGGASGMLIELMSGGRADLLTSDYSRQLADKIVNESIKYVAEAREKIGAKQKLSIEVIQEQLQDERIQLETTESIYSNADFAVEASRLTKLQLLLQSGTSMLSLTNQIPQYAANLIG
jgi:flagellin-like hook-associated protein FlgL